MKDFAKKFYLRFNSASPHGSKKRIAKALGCSQETVTRWTGKGFKNKLIPSIYEAYMAAKVLGIPPGYLAFGEGPTPLNSDEIAWLTILRNLDETQRQALHAILASWNIQTPEELPMKKRTPAQIAADLEANQKDEIEGDQDGSLFPTEPPADKTPGIAKIPGRDRTNKDPRKSRKTDS